MAQGGPIYLSLILNNFLYVKPSGSKLADSSGAWSGFRRSGGYILSASYSNGDRTFADPERARSASSVQLDQLTMTDSLAAMQMISSFL